MSPGMYSEVFEQHVTVGRHRVPKLRRRSYGASNSPSAIIDKFAAIPIAACSFALIVFPLLTFYSPVDPRAALEARPETRIFWPLMAAISILLTVQKRSRFYLPPNIICLFAYLAFAGATVLWAFSPDRSLIRYFQEIMIVISVVPPVILAGRNVDVMRALFLCFALALILNLVIGRSDLQTDNFRLIDIGYSGYFMTKNPLGEAASVAFLLSLYEIFQTSWRRVFGIIVGGLSIYLVFLSQSKTAFALALICPLIVWPILSLSKAARVSPALIIIAIAIFYVFISNVFDYDVMGRVSYLLYHDSTLTGRTIIWDYAKGQIAQRPLLGWGYRSFWLVPDSPSLKAPGFVKIMPNAHNGYYDTILETGYVGLGFLLVFIIATLHAIGRVADRDPSRARFLLSLALFFILYNFFESLWMRAFEVLWVVFLVTAAEIARYWRPLPVVGRIPTSQRQSPSVCARTGSQTPVSKTTTPASTRHAKPGED
jgi:exopolysaccharide production protein ExoQ